MTDVDRCEREPDAAFATNAVGTRNVCRAAESVSATLIYISTNFVFSGEKSDPYHEFDDPTPINRYGASKLAGEREAIQAGCRSYVVRTSMVFDKSGRNFVNTMRNLMETRDVVSVVGDQFGNPTYAPDLAVGLLNLLDECPPGTYHLTNSGEASWFTWASEIRDVSGYACAVRPIPGDEYERPAQPPANGLIRSIAWPEGQAEMPHWKDALRRCLS